MKQYDSIKELEADQKRLRAALQQQESRIGQDASRAWDHTKQQLNPLNALHRMLQGGLGNVWVMLGLRIIGHIIKKKL